MDSRSLTKEYESYKENIENTNELMNLLSNFFSNFYKNLNDYAINTQKNFSLSLGSLIKLDNKSSYIKKFLAVCRLFEKHLQKLVNISKRIYTELVQPTNDFSKYLINDNNIQLNELKKIINETSVAKDKYDKIKHEYFKVCRSATEQEQNLLKEMETKDELSIKAENNILTQLRMNSQFLCQKYKSENVIINNIYELNNKKYFPIVNNLKDNEEKRINFLYSNFEKFITYLTEKKKSLDVFINSLNEDDTNKNILKVKLDDDMKEYEKKFNYCLKDKIRFVKEDLLLYEIHKNNIASLYNNQNDINKNKSLEIFPTHLSYNPNIFNFQTITVKLDLDNQIIFDVLFDGKAAEPKINYKNFSAFKKRLIDDIKFAEGILDKMLGEVFQKPIFYQFKNFEKFEGAKQILISISMNEGVRTDYIDMNYAIIFIAEKGFFYDKEKNEKKYLSKEMTKEDNNFKSKNFWKKLLVQKINIAKNKISEKMKKDNSIKTDGSIPNKNLMNLIKEYIMHFTNFNLSISDINDILLELKTEYSLSNKDISFLICFLNSHSYNIKSRYHKNANDQFFTKKIENTKSKKYKQILLVLNSCFMFLEPKDFINIKNINKTYYKQLEKLIYKQIFIKRNKNFLHSKMDLSNIENHFGMWFNYLKYDPKKNNYQEILSKIKESKSLNNVIDIINLDVMRTHFENDKENKRNKIKNVLLALSYKYPETSYWQGMNYIAQFLLELTGSEEKSFDIFSAIINKTEYSKLSLNDFELMKKYFYIFQRLISIYLPELYTTFQRNNINANYFISPWFITLYTHSFNGNHKKILLFIFDLFILDGWHAITRIGLTLLKHYQNEFFQMEFEDLLHFLINELKEKYDFFNNNNYEKFIQLYKEMKLPKGLINNLENEYELNKSVGKEK